MMWELARAPEHNELFQMQKQPRQARHDGGVERIRQPQRCPLRRRDGAEAGQGALQWGALI